MNRRNFVKTSVAAAVAVSFHRELALATCTPQRRTMNLCTPPSMATALGGTPYAPVSCQICAGWSLSNVGKSSTKVAKSHRLSQYDFQGVLALALLFVRVPEPHNRLFHFSKKKAQSTPL